MKIIILSAGSGNTPRELSFDLDRIRIGRGVEDCEIVFDNVADPMVSRHHAEIIRQGDDYFLRDSNSFNGTILNGQRITNQMRLSEGDEIQLGIGGPRLEIKETESPSRIAHAMSGEFPGSSSPQEIGAKTIVFKSTGENVFQTGSAVQNATLILQTEFGVKKEISIGRAPENDLKLDGLLISNRHARLLKTSAGIVAEDLNSTNGVYVNGERISRGMLTSNDALQIGAFVIRADAAGNVGVFDTRSKVRVDCLNVSKRVKNRGGSGALQLLDSISVAIQPNEFVGVIGSSGAGKSTLISALAGMCAPSSGNLLINNTDLYQNLSALKQSIGCVPQDDIVHPELSASETLNYVAKLRLSRDVSGAELNQIVNEVLDVTGISERRNSLVSQLSGGERKRLSIAVELITKPSVILLDEPTAGLDPATEEKIMKLFRQIAESGRTVILTTHAMENIRLFDKVLMLMRGKLIFAGTPDEALRHFGVAAFKELYDKIEEPLEAQIRVQGEASRAQLTQIAAEEFKNRFLHSEFFSRNVAAPLQQVAAEPTRVAQRKIRLGIFGGFGQFVILSRRYFRILFRDKLTLTILFLQAPLIALFTFFVMGAKLPRDFLYFILSIVSIWFGTSVAAREIVRERPVYLRERMVNLGIIPYVVSKLFVLGIIVALQNALFFLPLKFLDLAGLLSMPGALFGIPQFIVMVETAAIGIALGLFVSSLVKTSEMATSLVPLILIPQILFSGLVGVPHGFSKITGMAMPAAWSFDSMKRLSGLDTLEPEGADPRGKTRGLGYYKFVEKENERIIADAKRDFENYRDATEKQIIEASRENGLPRLSDPPKVGDPVKVGEDLSAYVTFLHPWMNEIVNQLVMMLMFFVLIILTSIILRMRDFR